MLTNYFRNRFYPLRDTVNHDVVFLRWIEGSLEKEFRVLDIGAGDGSQWKYFIKGRCHKVIGIDLEEGVLRNTNLDEGVVGDDGAEAENIFHRVFGG